MKVEQVQVPQRYVTVISIDTTAVTASDKKSAVHSTQGFHNTYFPELLPQIKTLEPGWRRLRFGDAPSVTKHCVTFASELQKMMGYVISVTDPSL